MTNVADDKRLNDEELEAVAGGITPLTIDPSTLASLAHLTVSSAVAGGGAYTMETTTPAHTDTGTPTITGQTHTTVSGASLFGGSSVIAPDSSHLISTSAPVVSGTVTISGNLHIDVPAQQQQPEIAMSPPIPNNQQGQFTKVTPMVTPVDESGQGPNLGGALGRSWGNF